MAPRNAPAAPAPRRCPVAPPTALEFELETATYLAAEVEYAARRLGRLAALEAKLIREQTGTQRADYTARVMEERIAASAHLAGQGARLQAQLARANRSGEATTLQREAASEGAHRRTLRRKQQRARTKQQREGEQRAPGTGDAHPPPQQRTAATAPPPPATAPIKLAAPLPPALPTFPAPSSTNDFHIVGVTFERWGGHHQVVIAREPGQDSLRLPGEFGAIFQAEGKRMAERQSPAAKSVSAVRAPPPAAAEKGGSPSPQPARPSRLTPERSTTTTPTASPSHQPRARRRLNGEEFNVDLTAAGAAAESRSMDVEEWPPLGGG
jgi:hypothetical protein